MRMQHLPGLAAAALTIAGVLSVRSQTDPAPMALPADGLTVGGNQLAVRDGRVGIGTDRPQADLDVAGELRLRGGAPAEGKLLVSDHLGRARWASAEELALTLQPEAIDAVRYGTIFGPLLQQPLNLQAAGRRVLRLEPTVPSPNLIGGLELNTVLPRTAGATISGGGHPEAPNRVDADFGVVGGGAGNRTEAAYATIGGGWDNRAVGVRATIGGGRLNAASAPASTVAGGFTNRADAGYASIGGGYANRAAGYVATIAGGWGNHATGTVSSVAGGQDNLAAGDGAAIGGGWQHRAIAQGSAISGGKDNRAGGAFSAIGGGAGNRTPGDGAAVAGGSGNTAAGPHAAVPGGAMNTAAGDFSLAAGRRAHAVHPGSFVWGDGSNTEFASTHPNQFAVQASGGARFATDPAGTAGVSLPPGSGAWATLGDRRMMENVEPVDPQEVLRAVAALPVRSWNYATEDERVRHLGPTSQDFQAAFHLGHDDTTISTVDAAGIALAAIQGLHQLADAQSARIRALEQANQDLARRLLHIEQRLPQEDDDDPPPPDHAR